MKTRTPLSLLLFLPFFLTGCGSSPPENLGLRDGRLAPCPDTPNCVSSFAPVSDATHRIEPLRYEGDRERARRILLELLRNREQESVTIVETDEDYIRAEFRTPVMRFTDDIEFYLPASGGVIHLRSASRVGRSDLGTNRRRIESLRRDFNLKYQE